MNRPTEGEDITLTNEKTCLYDHCDLKHFKPTLSDTKHVSVDNANTSINNPIITKEKIAELMKINQSETVYHRDDVYLHKLGIKTYTYLLARTEEEKQDYRKKLKAKCPDSLPLRSSYDALLGYKPDALEKNFVIQLDSDRETWDSTIETRKYCKKYAMFNDYIDYYKLVELEKKIPDADKCFYEHIQDTSKMFYDIDINLREHKMSMAEGLKLVEMVIKYSLEVYTFDLTKVALLTSHGTYKLSWHIVINGYSCNLLIRKAIHKYVVSKIPEPWRQFVDPAVYSNNRPFRIMNCTKRGANRPGIFVNKWTYENKEVTFVGNDCETDNDIPEDLLRFEASLVSLTLNCIPLVPLVNLDLPVVSSTKTYSAFTIDELQLDEIKEVLFRYYGNRYEIPKNAIGKGNRIRLCVSAANRKKGCPVCGEKVYHKNNNPYLQITENGVVKFGCYGYRSRSHFLTVREIRIGQIKMDITVNPDSGELTTSEGVFSMDNMTVQPLVKDNQTSIDMKYPAIDTLCSNMLIDDKEQSNTKIRQDNPYELITPTILEAIKNYLSTNIKEIKYKNLDDDGFTVIVERRDPGICNWCNGFHTADAVSGTVKYRHGGVRFYCGYGGYQHLFQHRPITEIEKQGRDQSLEALVKAELEVNFTSNIYVETVDGPRLNPIDFSHRVNLIDAAKGVGKTETLFRSLMSHMKTVVEKARENETGTILFLSARIKWAKGLISRAKRDFNITIANYMDLPSKGMDQADILVISAESLYKIQKTRNFELIVIDEISSFVRQMYSTTQPDKFLGNNRMVLENLLTYSSNVVAMDAKWTKSGLDLLRYFLPTEKFHLQQSTYRPCKDHMVRCLTVEDWGARMESLVKEGKSISISFPVSSRHRAELIYKRLVNLGINKQHIRIYRGDSDTNDELDNINTLIRREGIRYLIYTSVISAGIDIQEPFDYCMAFGCNTACTYDEFLQMIGRVRNITMKTIYYTALNRGDNLPIKLDQIRKQEKRKCNNIKEAIDRLYLHDAYVNIGGKKLYYTFTNNIWVKLRHQQLQLENLSRCFFTQMVILGLREEGYIIEGTITKATAPPLSDGDLSTVRGWILEKNSKDEAEKKLYTEAKVVSGPELDKLKEDKHSITAKITVDKRYTLQKFLDPSKVSPDELYLAVKKKEQLEMMRRYRDNVDYLTLPSECKDEYRDDKSQKPRDWTILQGVRDVMKLLEVKTLLPWDSTIGPYSSTTIEGWENDIKTIHNNYNTLLGGNTKTYPVTRDAIRKYVNKVLKRINLKLKNKKTGGKAKRGDYLISIDPNLTLLLTKIKPYYKPETKAGDKLTQHISSNSMLSIGDNKMNSDNQSVQLLELPDFVKMNYTKHKGSVTKIYKDYSNYLVGYMQKPVSLQTFRNKCITFMIYSSGPNQGIRLTGILNG